MEKHYGKLGIDQNLLSLLSTVSILIAALLVIASGSGLLINSIYATYVKGQTIHMLLGQDLLSLICLPILLFAIFLTWRKAIIGPVIWTGILLYIAYAYALLAFGAVYNYLFLIYIALIGLSIYSLIILIVNINYRLYRDKLDAIVSVKVKGIYLIAIGTIISSVWVLLLIRTIITSEPIVGINTVYVLDLTLLLPAFIIIGIQQLRHITWSFYLAGVLLVKAVTLGLSIMLGDIISMYSGLQINIGLFGMFSLFTIFGGVLLYTDVQKMSE
jgi:hypothetical protein